MAHRSGPGPVPQPVERARALLQAGRYAAAQVELARWLDAQPADVDAAFLHAVCCHELGEFEQAIAGYGRVLARRAGQPRALGALANAWRDLGDFTRSDALYGELLAAHPDFAQARNDYAHSLLVRGRFAEGWAHYEARWEANRWRDREPYTQPAWNGEPLDGRRILVWGEQGLGDQILFAGQVPEIAARARACSVVCEDRLRGLFARSFPGATVLERRSREHFAACREAFDFQVPVGSLGRHLRARPEDFPAHRGYLRADPARVQAWRLRLAGIGAGRKVGVSWRGGGVATRRHLRSIPLDEWLPLLRTPGTAFVSLQYDDCAREIGELRDRHGVTVRHWQEAIDDYDETAALVCALDLVISVCTSLVHLAGALGRPAWVLVPAVPEWRYLREGEATPWYPSLRLIRQPRVGEWGPVLGQARVRLREFIGL
jgi:tetratricopeptide (TPR) repeat protein